MYSVSKALVRILPAILLALVACSICSAATTYTANSCSQSDVSNAIGRASDGDTVALPSCATGVVWSTQLDIKKAITLQGAGCMLDSKGRPSSCSTVIIDGGNDSSAIIAFFLVANKTSRMTGIEFRDGGSRPNAGAQPVIYVEGQPWDGPQDARRMRIDHNRFIRLKGLAPMVKGAWGLADHNYYELKSGNYFATYFYQPGSYNYADARWSEPTDWGTDKFWFMENNTVTREAGAPFYALLDQYAGARTVVRFNDITQSYIEAHGTESSGRSRGTRAVEAYRNDFRSSNGTTGEYVDLRSGAALVWGNTGNGFTYTPAAIRFNNQRGLGGQLFGGSDGTSRWDVNSAANPIATYTSSGYTIPGPADYQQTVSVNGAGWTTNQWLGYHVHKVGCVPIDAAHSCGLLVRGNTSDTLTLEFGHAGLPEYLDLPSGTQFTLNKIDHVMDAPCRSGGTLLKDQILSSLTSSGTTATAMTRSAHGYSTGDWVYVADAQPNVYQGSFQITVTGSSTFTYRLGSTPPSAASYPGSVTKAPFGGNDQITDQCYQWSNTHNGTNLFSNPHYYPVEIRANEHYFDYDPSKIFDGSAASTRSGVGVGPIGNRPATCTAGAAYWATDEGEWDSTNNGPDGRLYKCIATNTWALYYTPFAYPHPMIDGSYVPTGTGAGTGTGTDSGTNVADTTAPTPGNAGSIASSINTDSATLSWTKATDNMSSQTTLQYEVRLSTSNDIGTVADAEAFGAVAVPYATDINSAAVPGWNPGTTYFFNVIVKDAAGNKAAYTTKSVTTTVSDPNPPVPGNSGLISSTSTSNSATLNWARATRQRLGAIYASVRSSAFDQERHQHADRSGDIWSCRQELYDRPHVVSRDGIGPEQDLLLQHCRAG